MSQFETISYKIEGHVATICLNRPETKNSFNQKMRFELSEAITSADEDQNIRAIVLSGSEGAFSAGQDLSEKLEGGAPIVSLVKDEYGPIIHRIDKSNKLFIAAIEGPCAGIGTAVALACDFVVMSVDSYFYLAFISIGLLPDGGATWQLVNQLGYKRAMEIILSGKPLPAEQAVSLGLANRISKDTSALEDAETWAYQLAENAPLAVGYSKRAAKSAMQNSFDDTFSYEGALQAILFGSEDSKEGIAAFKEKRKPVFAGQ